MKWSNRINHLLIRAQLALQDGRQRALDSLVREEGQAMAEYVVMLVVVALALAAVVALAGTIRSKFEQVNGQIGGAY